MCFEYDFLNCIFVKRKFCKIYIGMVNCLCVYVYEILNLIIYWKFFGISCIYMVFFLCEWESDFVGFFFDGNFCYSDYK